MSKELIDIDLRQGSGKNLMLFSMSLHQETIDTMNQINEEDPEKWRDRDLDLLHEAHERMGIDTLPKYIVMAAYDSSSSLFWLFWDDTDIEDSGNTNSLFIEGTEYSLSSLIGLKEWFSQADRYDPNTSNPEFNPTGMEEWINQGYKYATQLREIIPQKIDLYYQFRHNFGNNLWEPCRVYISSKI